jgi:hypothetical protein
VRTGAASDGLATRAQLARFAEEVAGKTSSKNAAQRGGLVLAGGHGGAGNAPPVDHRLRWPGDVCLRGGRVSVWEPASVHRRKELARPRVRLRCFCRVSQRKILSKSWEKVTSPKKL